jgi:hypothetical protein
MSDEGKQQNKRRRAAVMSEMASSWKMLFFRTNDWLLVQLEAKGNPVARGSGEQKDSAMECIAF